MPKKQIGDKAYGLHLLLLYSQYDVLWWAKDIPQKFNNHGRAGAFCSIQVLFLTTGRRAKSCQLRVFFLAFTTLNPVITGPSIEDESLIEKQQEQERIESGEHATLLSPGIKHLMRLLKKSPTPLPD